MYVELSQELGCVLEGGRVPECELSEGVEEEEELRAVVVSRLTPELVARVEPVLATNGREKAVDCPVTGFQADLQERR